MADVETLVPVNHAKNAAGYRKRKGPSPRSIAAIVWLSFSVALAIWWMIFGFNQIDRFRELAEKTGDGSSLILGDMARQHRMLLSEGMTLIVLLIGGGVALLYFIRVEALRSARLREFFAAFTHDLKTSLASLRLQAESLEEDLKASPHEKLMRRLVKDTVRLELQLENSLLLASPDDASRFFAEPVKLSDVLGPLKFHWPELKVDVEGDALIECDQRAIESILKNLLQNSLIHGRATEVRIKTMVVPSSEKALIRVVDNGRGFKGDSSRLGTIFERLEPTSGSGLGLHLARRLARQMKGDLKFIDNTGEGFAVEISIPLAREVRQ